MTDTAKVVVTYLERPAVVAASIATQTATPAPFLLHRETAPAAAGVAALMYARVGTPWQWTDRRRWTPADWERAIHRDDVEVWVARIDDEIAGYFQLQVEADAVELQYFGLVPAFTGRGFGGRLLSAAIARASSLGKDRITVNTCTLDHPAALANYLKHGFTVVRTGKRQQVFST
jgi:ribosomal protein S18 acetylase RimI-like enzyme